MPLLASIRKEAGKEFLSKQTIHRIVLPGSDTSELAVILRVATYNYQNRYLQTALRTRIFTIRF